MKEVLVKLPSDYWQRLEDVLYESKIRDQKPYELSSYQLVEFDLGTARSSLELKSFPRGNYVYVYSLDGTAEIQFGKDSPAIALTLDDSFKFPKSNPQTVFLSNTEQVDKEIVFLIAQFEFKRK